LAVDDVRELAIRRLLDSPCAARFQPSWPVCIVLEEALPQPATLDGVFVPPVDLAYPSADLVTRLRRVRPAVLSPAECLDRPLSLPRITVTVRPLQRWWRGDDELLVRAGMDSVHPEAPRVRLDFEATAVMERGGWILSRSKVELRDFTPLRGGGDPQDCS
jgi:hypothetical protein